MRDTLEQIRRTLGEDAVILDTRVTRDGAATRVEVWAAPPEGTAPPEVLLSASPDDATLESAPAEAPDTEAPAASSTEVAEHFSDLQDKLTEVHAGISTLEQSVDWLGVAPPDGDPALGFGVGDALAHALSYSGGVSLTLPRLVAFVGPTGAGKTTLAARLAWHAKVERGLPVGILCADTVRLGALETMRLLCRDLEMPLAPIYRPEELPAARAAMGDALILLDLPGGSPRDPAHLAELRALLTAVDPHEVHLVLCANYRAGAVAEMLSAYRTLEPDQLALTRLDQFPALAELTPVLTECGLALSYLCDTGTLTVPPVPADADAFARYLGLADG